MTIYGGDGGDDDYDDGELPKLHMLRPAEIVRQSEMRIYKSGYRGLLQSAFRPLPEETEKVRKTSVHNLQNSCFTSEYKNVKIYDTLILRVDLYGCENLWSECKVFKKTISIRMFGFAVETEPR